MIGIYKITSPSGRVYIGQSINLEERLRKYKCINRSKHQPRLNRSFKKYGIENHIFEIIQECKKDELNELERYFQEYFNCTETGLNCILTKTEIKPFRHSEESRKKMSLSQKGEKSSWWGKKHTEETKSKMRNYHVLNKNPMLGKFGSECVNSKKVINTETKEIFDSCKEAAEKTNMKYSTLRSYLNGSLKNKTKLIYYNGNTQ